MKPGSYTKNEKDTTIFHYSFSQLREFIKHGKEFGDNGWILIKREGAWKTFKGFGTIEHPLKEMITMTFCHHPLFDGEMCSDDEIINPKPRKEVFSSSKLFFFDMSTKAANSNEILKKYP